MRSVKLNNYINPISSREVEFKVNEMYGSKNEIISHNDKVCRICLEQDDDEYISPCLCKGTQKYVHRSCLNQWRNVNMNNPEKRNSCEICKYKFHFKSNLNLNYSNYLIVFDKFLLIDVLLIWFVTLTLIWLDVLCRFFIIRTMNLYSDDNSTLLVFFRESETNEDAYYMTYVLFYLPFSFFLFEIRYLIKFHYKYSNLLKDTQYKERMGCYLNRYYIQTFNFLYYYYICLFIDQPMFYLFTNILNIFFNSFYRIAFYKKHNRILTNIINAIEDTEEILSFEENPILNIVFGETEKTELEVLAETDSEESSNSNDDSSISSESDVSIYNVNDLLNLNG